VTSEGQPPEVRGPAAREAPEPGVVLEAVSKTVQVVSVVAGVVISVLSFNAARVSEVISREAEAAARRAEAARPFLELRQKYYLEAVDAAGVLATEDDTNSAEYRDARKRFRHLYVATLSLVESRSVEAKMVSLAAAVDPTLVNLSPKQRAAYGLSHALRDSLARSWTIDDRLIDNPTP